MKTFLLDIFLGALCGAIIGLSMIAIDRYVFKTERREAPPAPIHTKEVIKSSPFPSKWRWI